MKLPSEFHGTFRTTFEQHLWFNGIQWNFRHLSLSFMEFRGILFGSKSSKAFHGTFSILYPVEFHATFNFPKNVPWNTMKFQRTWSVWYLRNKLFWIMFLVFGWFRLKIVCYLAKFSQKYYQMHSFQYYNPTFGHSMASENWSRSAKMGSNSVHVHVYSYSERLGKVTATSSNLLLSDLPWQ